MTHACSLLTDGSVLCWGANNYGQLGNNTIINSPTAVPVQGLTGVVDIAVGDNHSCAVSGDGRAFCWGYNQYGQLGNASSVNSSVPVQVVTINNFSEIACGYRHTCGMTSSGSVYCWGRNESGALGLGDSTNGRMEVSPVVLPLTAIQNISASDTKTCALKNDGTVYCWGWGSGGNAPVLVGGLTTVTKVSGGGNACGITHLGKSASCWLNSGPAVVIPGE